LALLSKLASETFVGVGGLDEANVAAIVACARAAAMDELKYPKLRAAAIQVLATMATREAAASLWARHRDTLLASGQLDTLRHDKDPRVASEAARLHALLAKASDNASK